MSIRSDYYESNMIMRSKDLSSLRIVDLWTFKSTKSHKRYIVEIEKFNKHFYGLKFYWKAVADSKERYSLLTNDYEPRKIVMSCIYIMLHYYKQDNLASFGFVAAPDIAPTQGYINKRFRFYRRMMLSLFSTEKFVHVNDSKRYIYLLVNKFMLMQGEISIADVEAGIESIYAGDFEISVDD